MKIDWLPPCSDPYGDWPRELIEQAPGSIGPTDLAEPYDPDTHHHECGCEGCLLDHFGKVMRRESQGGWGE